MNEMQNTQSSGEPVEMSVADTRDISGNASSTQELIAALRRVRAFADLPEEQLAWFIEHSEEMRLAPGEILFRKGDPPNWMIVYLEGEVQARRDENASDGFVYIARAGDPASEVSGKLPFSRMSEISATARVVAPTRLLLFGVELFPELMERMPVLVQRLVGVMSDRVREVTKADQQRDKLMSLGKLSAGLAHELNNPAAAARRAAHSLRDALGTLHDTNLRLCRHQLTTDQRDFLARYEHDLLDCQRAAPENRSQSVRVPLSAIEQSDREEVIGSWLDMRGVDNAWELAPTLVESGIEIENLNEIEAGVGAEILSDALTRLVAQLSAARLTEEIETSAGRISELVAAIKEYTYMDRAPVQEVDVHTGIENTLLILNHKIKKKSIEVAREYAPELPRITAFGSELNQVWTNLLDNAIDAMNRGGRLQVRTAQEGDNSILVEICDNGAGIPPDIASSIFDPFFTTKPVGEGTGLGLDTVYRIVRKHHGDIRFNSVPGDTRFQVRLPLKQQANGNEPNGSRTN